MKGEEIRHERERRFWTVKTLSEKSGVSEDTITKLENSDRRPHALTAAKLRRALKLRHTLKDAAAGPECEDLLRPLKALTAALEGHYWQSDMPAREFHRLLNEAQVAIARAEGRA